MIGDMTDKIDMISVFLRLFNLEPKIHCYYTDDFACLCPQFLQTKLYRYCSLMIFETVVCIRITVIFIIRFVCEEAFKLMFESLFEYKSKRLSNWCLCLGSTLFTVLLLSRPQRIFSSISAIISWCVPLIVFQLCGCFQEFLVGVEKVAFTHPQGSIIGFLSSPLFSHICGHVFFFHICGSYRFADLHRPYSVRTIFERFHCLRDQRWASTEVSHIGSILVQMMKIVRKEAFYFCFCFSGCVTKMHQPHSESCLNHVANYVNHAPTSCIFRILTSCIFSVTSDATHWPSIDLWPHAYSAWPLTSHPSRDLTSCCCEFATQLKQFTTIDEIRGAIDAIRDNDNIDFKYWPGWV